MARVSRRRFLCGATLGGLTGLGVALRAIGGHAAVVRARRRPAGESSVT
jgi:hypothetical protein